MTEEEIQTCIKMGWDEGAITAEERKMLSRVFTLNDKTIGEVMVPRGKMAVLDFNASIAELSKRKEGIQENNHHIMDRLFH